MKLTRTALPPILSLSVLILSSCAGAHVAGVDDQDVAAGTKFEVRPLEQSGVIIASAAAPIRAKAAKLPSRKKTARVALASIESAPPAFIYPSRRPANDPIIPGEKAVYEITYFGAPAGNLTLNVLPYKEVNSRKVYHVQAQAKSSMVFSLFYRLDDTIESYVDYEGLFSHRYDLKLDESIQTRSVHELYDSEKGEAVYWSRWNHKTKGILSANETRPMKPFPQDYLSAFYYLRTLPLEIGKVISFPVVNEGKTIDLQVTVLRRETIQTAIGKVAAVVVKPEVVGEKRAGESLLWISDDASRNILKLEAKVKVGTVHMTLKKIERS